LGSRLEEKLGVEKIKTNLDISVSKERANINEEIQKYNCLILDNEMDKKFLIESNTDYDTLPATEQVFINQIQRLNGEINDRKFKHQEAVFRLKEFTSKRNEIKVETESENGKFERKRRQVQRLMDAEQTKIDSLEVKQNQLFEESDDVEALKNQEKQRLSELSKYNKANDIGKLTAKIEDLENESNNILVENLINAQDAVDSMAEETSKLLNAQIEERLQQIKLIDDQIQKIN